MSWSTFDTRYRDTNKSVDFKELDDLICAKFRLRVEKLLGEGSIERYMVY